MLGTGIPYELLNAKPENVERESEIVAQSGRRGAVTISTNMAGRGTDILLGGNPEYMARVQLYLSFFSCVHSLDNLHRIQPGTTACAYELHYIMIQCPVMIPMIVSDSTTSACYWRSAWDR